MVQKGGKLVNGTFKVAIGFLVVNIVVKAGKITLGLRKVGIEKA